MTAILNQLAELIAFVQSVQTGRFSAAARILDTTPSAVSKRVAKLEDQLGVRLLQRTTRSLSFSYVVCASPDYFKTHGIPTTPEDLSQHNCLRFINSGHLLPWRFLRYGTMQEIPVSGSFSSDNGYVLRSTALAGLGIIYVLRFQVESDLRSGQLRSLFDEAILPSRVVQAVFTHRRNLSPRVQVFLEFLAAQMTQDQ